MRNSKDGLHETFNMLRNLIWILFSLKPSYYFRHFILISPFTLYILFHLPLLDKVTHSVINLNYVESVVYISISWLLYPFSRFVYESAVNWLTGGYVLIVNGLLWLFVKLFTMGLCLLFAVVLAPIAWIYLFCYFKFGEGKGDYNCN